MGDRRTASQLAALHEAGLFDGAPDPALDRITGLAAKLLKTPASLITLIDHVFDRQVFASDVGLPEPWATTRQTPLAYSVCAHVVEAGAPLLIANASKDARFKDNPALGVLGLAAYLGVPLTDESGEAFGALCVIDKKPRKWSEADSALLGELAALASRELALRVELRGRKRAEAKLGESEDDFQTLANFLPHLAWMADTQGKIYWLNQRWFDYTGLTPDQDANTAVHPDHYARVAEKYLRCTANGEVWEDVFPIRGMDGEYRWFLSRAMPRRDAQGRITRWFGANTDITERLQAEDRQALLMREIDHRAKNALAVVQAVVRLSRADSPADFQQAVEGRIAALARSHALLAQCRWEGADLAQLLCDELAPYVASDPERAIVHGPAYLLFPETAQTMALVLHELATNAAKHGALSRAGGRLQVAWETMPDGGLSLNWTETLDTPVPKATRKGFGTSLFAQSIERHLGGTYEMNLHKTGLVCTLRIPARPAPPQETGSQKKKADMSRKKILLVEDDAMIAMEMEERLIEMGYAVIGPAATIEAAESAIAREMPDAALLDANLRGRTTVDLGASLIARGVKVAFCTGYEEVKGLPAHMADVPVLTKPVLDDALSRMLKALLGD
jgi:PAS domain S-box-containing protein